MRSLSSQLESKLVYAWSPIQTVSSAFESAALPVFDTVYDDDFADADLASLVNDNMTRGLLWSTYKNADHAVLDFTYTGCVRYVFQASISSCSALIPAQLHTGSRMGERHPICLSSCCR